ncbi:MAG TPA: hypothetical protein VKF62_00235, partial [Planctomycetota bacterium]|nr:hypothetical protein [Planctomycetota bacterium]
MEPYLKTFSDRVGDWLAAGSAESDVVISTRIRLARNVSGYPFVGRLKEEQAADLAKELRERILGSGFAEEPTYLPLREASKVCRELLLERHLISRELAGAKWERGVAFGRGETVGVMVNEEDHLRIQVLLSGLALDAAWERMDRADRAPDLVLEAGALLLQQVGAHVSLVLEDVRDHPPEVLEDLELGAAERDLVRDLVEVPRRPGPLPVQAPDGEVRLRRRVEHPFHLPLRHAEAGEMDHDGDPQA